MTDILNTSYNYCTSWMTLEILATTTVAITCDILKLSTTTSDTAYMFLMKSTSVTTLFMIHYDSLNVKYNDNCYNKDNILNST